MPFVIQLHGPCGVFNGDDSAITFRNRCFSCPGPIKELSFLSLSPNVGGAATLTQQFAVASAKDVDAKKVGWEDIVPGDRPSIKAGESGQMVKSVATIYGIDAMSFGTEQLRVICAKADWVS